jgi:hypothetical protein
VPEKERRRLLLEGLRASLEKLRDESSRAKSENLSSTYKGGRAE